MAHRIVTTLLVLAAAFALAGPAQARGGNYTIVGGSDEAQAQVRAALEASRFDWSLLPEVTIEITRCGCAGAQPGTIILDENILTRTLFGIRYAWGIVQHEYAHQVDFLLLRPRDRKVLRRQLGGEVWCYEQFGLAHSDHGCERFATAVAWAFWPSAENIQRPNWQAKKPLRAKPFRKLVNRLAGRAAAARATAA
jgi:hypothetical protein